MLCAWEVLSSHLTVCIDCMGEWQENWQVVLHFFVGGEAPLFLFAELFSIFLRHQGPNPRDIFHENSVCVFPGQFLAWLYSFLGMLWYSAAHYLIPRVQSSNALLERAINPLGWELSYQLRGFRFVCFFFSLHNCSWSKVNHSMLAEGCETFI